MKKPGPRDRTLARMAGIDVGRIAGRRAQLGLVAAGATAGLAAVYWVLG